MNRIILIGNGFDLAHGMKTSYKDFINSFWERKCDEIKEGLLTKDDPFISFDAHNFKYNNYENFNDLDSLIKKDPHYGKFKNHFFYEITKKNGLENWVDIENEYYLRLKKYSKENDSDSVKNLNKELKQIEISLSNYLKDEEDNFDIENPELVRKKSKITSNIFSLIKYDELEISTRNKLINDLRIYNHIEGHELENELSKSLNILKNRYKDLKTSLEDIILTQSNLDDEGKFHFFVPKNILLLNFNYTDNHLLYNSFSTKSFGESQNIEQIKIHGCIREPEKNPIIFGFGDELDKDYQALEDLDDNDYLENIKSIKYLETQNYRKLLEFADSDEFQIFIFGHSCGNSDRTLLNTLFEHENCVSIKPFYYIDDKGKDNYSNIVRNISRNFKDKAKMRARVVNKTYTTTLTD